MQSLLLTLQPTQIMSWWTVNHITITHHIPTHVQWNSDENRKKIDQSDPHHHLHPPPHDHPSLGCNSVSETETIPHFLFMRWNHSTIAPRWQHPNLSKPDDRMTHGIFEMIRLIRQGIYHRRANKLQMHTYRKWSNRKHRRPSMYNSLHNRLAHIHSTMPSRVAQMYPLMPNRLAHILRPPSSLTILPNENNPTCVGQM